MASRGNSPAGGPEHVPAGASRVQPPTQGGAPRRGGIIGFLLLPVRAARRVLLWGRDADFEKQLQHLSKEEVAVHARIKRRAGTWRKVARIIAIYSLVIEVVILGVAVMMTWSGTLTWEARALRVLPVFLFPAFSFFVYACLSRFNRMRERRDHQILERLLDERQAKIDELKEKTNYYATQQLIQQYDTDPAVKAAAASILVAKLGAGGGVKAHIVMPGTDTKAMSASAIAAATAGTPPGTTSGGRVRDAVEEAEGLRRRRTSSAPFEKTKRVSGDLLRETTGIVEDNGFVSSNGVYSTENVDRVMERGLGGWSEPIRPGVGERDWEDEGERYMGERREVEREVVSGRQMSRKEGKATMGGWVARLAAMLVGEDPTQCYALICQQCHMHNGLARKEDYPYITYFCPRCNHLNKAENYRGDRIQSQAPSPLERARVRQESDFQVHQGPAPRSLSFGAAGQELDDAEGDLMPNAPSEGIRGNE